MVEFTLFGKPFKVLGYKGFFLSGDAIDMSVLGMFLLPDGLHGYGRDHSHGRMAERLKVLGVRRHTSVGCMSLSLPGCRRLGLGRRLAARGPA